MAKAAGYLRTYRERRTANKGRPLGRALSASEREEVDMLVQNYGYSPAKAAAEVRKVNDLLRLQTAILQGDFSKIAPRGRAPRGQGEEWKARRQIADTLSRANVRQGRAEAGRKSYRGTKAGRYDEGRRASRSQAMNMFHQEATRILQSPGSWKQKATAVRDSYSYAAALISTYIN